MGVVAVEAGVVCRVLGPVEVEVDGVGVRLAGSRARRLVAALAAADGMPLSDDLLAELVWQDEQPAAANQALRVLVWRLRSTAMGDCLTRTSAGYAFEVPVTDRWQFTDLVTSGKDVASFEAALALWRGQPWADLGDSSLIVGARARLEELRQVAVEELQAARLQAGEIGAAIAGLQEAVAESPYRERRWELLARGLCLAGLPERAADELRRVRRLLAEDLGIDPGPALCALERQLLSRPRPLVRSRRWR